MKFKTLFSIPTKLKLFHTTTPCSHIITPENLLQKTQTGLLVLDLLDSGSLTPTFDLYSDLIKACTASSSLPKARLVHAHFLKSTLRPDPFLATSFLNMFAKCGSMEDALKVFDEMPDRNVVTWTAFIGGYTQTDLPIEAVGLVPKMVRDGVMPNAFTFASIFKAVGACKWGTFGKQAHGFCAKCGLDGNVYVGSSLLDMYARIGEMGDARVVFEGLGSRNEVSWNVLIAGHERRGEGEVAVKLFWEMQREGVAATHFTYSSVFGACAGIGSLEQGRWVHAHMVKTGHKLTSFVGNTLLDMYAKAGSIVDAKKVFDRLWKKDVVSWNSLLKGFAQHGFAKEAIGHFHDMLKCGIAPNGITYLCILSACSHGGLLDEGKKYFALMDRYKVEREIEHYAAMVDLLGRAGLLDQAEKFIKEMPIQPSAAVWGALLGACRMHKNAELGKYAAERVFELDPCDSGPHILLSNIYASAGRWNEAAKVRKTMKDTGVKKEPACSWVEIENHIHTFVAEDTSHPQTKEIYAKWEEVNRKIKDAGYVPDTSHVLLLVDEKEREAKLQFHSEKLALAFALLRSPCGGTIHIKKNIRMCGDCHSAFKFASEEMGREIIVRDTKRFHHFNKGLCSCGDYW